MSSGNNMVDGEDKVLSKGDKCTCGGLWEDAYICDIDGKECNGPCPHGTHPADCEFYKAMLRCKECGFVTKGK